MDLFYHLGKAHPHLIFPNTVLHRVSEIADTRSLMGLKYTGQLARVGQTTLLLKSNNQTIKTDVYRFDLPSTDPSHQFYFLFPRHSKALAGFWHRQWRPQLGRFVSHYMDTTLPYPVNATSNVPANTVLGGGGSRLHEIRFETSLLENAHGYSQLQSTQTTPTYQGADQFHTAHGFAPTLKAILPLRERQTYYLERQEGLPIALREHTISTNQRRWQEVDWREKPYRGTKMAEISRVLDPKRGPILFQLRQRLNNPDKAQRLILD